MTSYPVAYRQSPRTGGLSIPVQTSSSVGIVKSGRPLVIPANSNRTYWRPPPPPGWNVRLQAYSRAASLSMLGQNLMLNTIQQAADIMLKAGIEAEAENYGTAVVTAPPGWARINQCGGGVGGTEMFVRNLNSVYCGPTTKTWSAITGASPYFMIRDYSVALPSPYVLPIYKYQAQWPWDPGGTPAQNGTNTYEALFAYHFPDYAPAVPAVPAVPAPRYQPWVARAVQKDAFILPPLAPMAEPVPEPLWRPATRPDPGRAPFERSVSGPYQRPNPQAGRTRVVVPGAVVEQVTSNWPKRPEKGTKERKFIVGVGDGLVGLVLNGVTETMDFIGAVYKGLPKSVRDKAGRRAAFTEKVDLLYRYWDQINIADAIEAVIINQLEDMAYGTVGKLYGKANRRLSSYGGGYRIQLQLGEAI